MIRRQTIGMLVLTSCLVAVAEAQVVTIPGTPSCPNCRIVADSLFTLGSPTDSVRPTSFGGVPRDTRGRFYALTDDHRVVVVFDGRGKLIGTIGRRGQGPGEFPGRLGSVRIGANDSLYVGAERQISVFDRDWRFVRQVRLPGEIHSFQPLPDGGFVGGMLIATQDPRRPFHIFNPDGTVQRSFGAEQPRPRGRGAPPRPLSERTVYPTTRFVLAPDRQSIWAPAAQYAIERWSFDGQLMQRYVIDAPWFERGKESEMDTVVNGNTRRIFPRRGVPAADHAGIDASGLHWFAGSIPVPGTVGTVDERQPRTFRLEILDLSARRTVVSVPMSRHLQLIDRSDLAVSGTANDDDEVTLTIWRVTLRRP